MLELPGYQVISLMGHKRRFSLYKGIRRRDLKPVLFKVYFNSTKNSAWSTLDIQHEYKLLNDLNLNGTLKILDFIKFPEQFVLVLEDIDAIFLKDYLKEIPNTNVDTYFIIALQLVDALIELHEEGIIHTNINPNNIFINPQTLLVKFSEFDFTKKIPQEIFKKTPAKQLKTMLAYIAPEQTGRTNRSLDYRSDFYSLGVLFYLMLSHKLPFSAKDALEMVHLHLTETPIPLHTLNKNIPWVLSVIVNKLLSKAPEDRYASAKGLKYDLLKCFQEWKDKKNINSFDIGKKDINEKLTLSKKLYGRHKEIEILLKLFAEIREGNTKLVFISGYSGIGKTSLVREIYKPVIENHGYFITGKYDQLQRSTPFTAIIEAFTGFIRVLLTESEAHLNNVKVKLLQALNNNGQVILNIIPELELIIGPQPPIVDLSPQETQNRFIFTFERFLKAITQLDHPIVLFLDDVQWIDNASLTLLNLLVNNADLKNLLIISAYRDNEMTLKHPIILIQQQLHQSGCKFLNLQLESLNKKAVNEFIHDSLNMSTKEINELTAVILYKTQGNPFFINEFLNKLFYEKILFYNDELCKWQWKIEKIQAIDVMDNVVDLIISRMQRLNPHARKIIQLAACIGYVFDLLTLSVIVKNSTRQIAKYILELINENFIVPVDETYMLLLEKISNSITPTTPISKKLKLRFRHDKIHEAAYQLIPYKLKSKVHLKIGRLLLKERPLTENDERLFEILKHFNSALDQIINYSECYQIALYNLWASKKAKKSSAYVAVKDYAKAGRYLIAELKTENALSLNFELMKELAISQYLTGEFKKAELIFPELIKLSKNSGKTIEIYKLNCELLATLNRHNEAITLGLKVLKSLKIYIPKRPTMINILWMIFKIRCRIGLKNIDTMDLSFISADKYKDATSLISQLFNSAFVTNQHLFIYLACLHVNLSLRFGYTESTGFALTVYSFVVLHGLNLHKHSANFQKLYHHLNNKYPQNNYAGKNEFVLAAFIEPYYSSFEATLNKLIKSYQLSLDVGDIIYSNYCNLLIIGTLFIMGKSLKEIANYNKSSLKFLKKTKTEDFLYLVQFWNFKIKALKNLIPVNNKIKYYENLIVECNNNTEICFFYSHVIKLYYLLEKFSLAVKYGRKFENYIEFGFGLVITVEGMFYYALSLLESTYHTRTKLNRKIIRKIYVKLKRLAKWNPQNYLQYFLLLSAEIVLYKKNISEAMQLYKTVIKISEENKTPHLLALAYECCGRAYQRLQISSNITKFYLDNALNIYQQLGYERKISIIKKVYPHWFALYNAHDHTPLEMVHSSNFSIDILSLMKFSQIISGEMHLDKLLKKLLIILLQNAGASHAMLIINDNDDWYVEAEGSIKEQKVTLLHNVKIEERNDLPLSLIRYVQRTKNILILQKPEDFDAYSKHDEYLSKNLPASVFLIPVLYQAQLKTILYLENRNYRQAFGKENLDILQILTSQAAISMQNARLYYHATHDMLTGLANRNFFYQIFASVAKECKNKKTLLAILYFDLDGFKNVNDTLGHEVGDKFLLFIANQIKLTLRANDLAARIGGDEFVVMQECETQAEINKFAELFLNNLSQSAYIKNHEIMITTSIGISIYPNDGESLIDLLREADIALYRAKALGKNLYQFYTSALDLQIRREFQQEIELRHAIENNSLNVFYQPIYSPLDHTITHFEALVRWHHAKYGILTADQFIHLAEKTSLILSIGKYVLETVAKQIKSWLEDGLQVKRIAVNISAAQFKKLNINDTITDLLRKYSIDPSYIELEFTENVAIEYSNKVLYDLTKLRALGIKLTLDDFGTYYSNISYLRQRFMQQIKIDKSFIQGITSSQTDQEIIVAIIQMAHSLNIKVIAEGIETKEQLEFLELNQIDGLQGFYLSKPLPGIDCHYLLKKINA